MFVGMLQPTGFQDHNKKILGKVLRFLDRVPATANEEKNRPPVSPAKFGQRLSRLLLIAL